ILNNRIGDIGKLTAFPNESITDGQGKVLAPGFIDTHSHHDRQLSQNPSATAAINQGITTIVVGQDGGSVPIDIILSRLDKVPTAINLATYTGHGWLRQQFMKDVRRKATMPEIDSMKVLLSHEMDKGSLGLSTGLEYEAAFYSTPEEVVDLAKVAAEKEGRYISHIRSEDIHLDEAIEEIIEIGRQAKIPVQISHFKIALRSKWGTAQKIINRLEEARLSGINITADVYPYTMWSSTPRVLFPKKDFENGASAAFATRELFDPISSVMVNYPPNRQWEGKTVSEIGKINNESPALALMRIIRESESSGAAIVANSMSERDISSFLKWPHSNVCSDGSIDGHPRGHGAFTRTLGRYVREQNLMPLETAIQKMTSLAAEHVGIKNRGQITPGYYADLVLFDPDIIVDNATITDSKAHSSGIETVWVNGKVVYQNQKAVPNYPGMFIKR
ncbi:MAG TPA: amidohydrolase family protein, partial [Cyclobacteriaceae bacterium]